MTLDSCLCPLENHEAHLGTSASSSHACAGRGVDPDGTPGPALAAGAIVGVAAGPARANTVVVLELFPGVRVLLESGHPARSRACCFSLGAGRAILVQDGPRALERRVRGPDPAT